TESACRLRRDPARGIGWKGRPTGRRPRGLASEASCYPPEQPAYSQTPLWRVPLADDRRRRLAAGGISAIGSAPFTPPEVEVYSHEARLAAPGPVKSPITTTLTLQVGGARGAVVPGVGARPWPARITHFGDDDRLSGRPPPGFDLGPDILPPPEEVVLAGGRLLAQLEVGVHP